MQYNIVNQAPTDDLTRFRARYVHLQEEIQNLYDSEHPLEFDVSFMAIYKNSLQIQAVFVESGGATTVIREWQTADRGSFALRQTGGASIVAVDPRVIGDLLDIIQRGSTGIFVFNIRTQLQPGEHEAVFPTDNIPSQALEAEFTRLDIQDRTKRQRVELENLSIENNHIAGDSVGTDQLAEQAVRQQAIAHKAVREEHIEDLSVSQDKLTDIGSDSIESRSLEAAQFADGAITKSKLSGAMLTEVSRFDDQAVTEDKIADKEVEGREVATFAVVNHKLAGSSITGDKIPKGTLKSDIHLAEGVDPLALQQSELTSDKLRNGSVRVKHLDRALQNKTRRSMPQTQLQVANPQNIPVGTPVGVKVVDGVPTVYRLKAGGFDE